MLALHYPAFDRLEIREVELSPPGADDVRIRVAACGICGSELESFKNRSPRRPPPLVMGHEFCGTIESVGPAVRGWSAGRRVVSNSVAPCGECVRCRRGDTHLCGARQIFGMHRPGAFAEFVNVPARCLLPWPDALPAKAAALAEPAANGLHVVNLTRHLPAATVLVIGAGPIGLFCQQALQVERGSRVFVADLSPDRLAVAARLGAAGIIDPRRESAEAIVAEATGGEGADLVVDAAGSEATKRLSLAALRPGGAAVWIGLHEDAVNLSSYAVTLPEKQVLGTYAAKLDELQSALALMAAGKIDAQSWVQEFPLTAGVEAFQRMLAGRGHDLKAVLQPA